MILSDRSIRDALRSGRIVIDPFEEASLQPSSVDLRLGNEFLIFPRGEAPIDVQHLAEATQRVAVVDGDAFVLEPLTFTLGATLETVELPDDLVGRLEGKSSLGRLGLLIHSTAGFVDPGWRGTLTLELFNVSSASIVLYPTMPIAQISFLRMTTPADRPYGSPGLESKYVDQTGPTPSRYRWPVPQSRQENDA